MVESIIPNGWAKVKFSDYIIFRRSVMSFLFKETGFPFVNISIENGSINKETVSL